MRLVVEQWLITTFPSEFLVMSVGGGKKNVCSTRKKTPMVSLANMSHTHTHRSSRDEIWTTHLVQMEILTEQVSREATPELQRNCHCSQVDPRFPFKNRVKSFRRLNGCYIRWQLAFCAGTEFWSCYKRSDVCMRTEVKTNEIKCLPLVLMR